MTKHLVVVSFQEENWEDDGGAHDPVVLEVDDNTLAMLKAQDGESVNYAHVSKLRAMQVTPTFPATIAWAGTVWFTYGK